MSGFYSTDLAWVQAEGYAAVAEGLAPDLLRRIAALPRAGTAPLHILDLGCGAGPWLRRAAAAGHRVTGVDVSADLLAHAARAVPAATLVHASIHDIDLPPADAVTALGEVLCYQPDPHRPPPLDALFARIHAALPPGGLLLFDVLVDHGEPSLTRQGWRDDLQQGWATLVDGVERVIGGDPDGGDAGRVVTRRIVTLRRLADYRGGPADLWRRSEETHHQQVWNAATLTARLERHGFAVDTTTRFGTFELFPRRLGFIATRR